MISSRAMTPTAALVTNVGRDHMGEFGVSDQESLVETKLVVRRALSYSGTLILNADDPALRAHGMEMEQPIGWFSLDPADEMVRRHVTDGGLAALVEEIKSSRFSLASAKGERTLSFRAEVASLQPGNPALFAAGYMPYVGAATTPPPFSDNGLIQETTYCYEIWALDDCANYQAQVPNNASCTTPR